jgi:excisionase family DNA binding protein
VSGPPDFGLKAAYYCCSEVMRDRRRRGEPIPQWLRQHYSDLDEQFRLSQSRHEFDCGGEQSDPENWITAKEAALMLGCSKRTVLRIATDLDGRMIGRRLLFDRRTVAAYVEGKRSA